MFIDDVKEYYGQIDENAEQLINDVIGKYSKKETEKLKNELFKAFPIGHFPDTEKLAKFFDSHKPATRYYYWAKCNDCGCEYDYSIPFCPSCEREGKHSSGLKIIKTDYEPAKKYIRLNKPWLTPYNVMGNKDVNGECVFCKKVDKPQENFCFHFGDPDYHCKYMGCDESSCKCSNCCSFYMRVQRKENEKMERKNV